MRRARAGGCRTRAGARVVALVLGTVLASGCTHMSSATMQSVTMQSVINDGTPSTSVVDQCHEDNRCPGGTGTLDAPVAYAVAGAMVAIIGVAVVKRLLDE